MDLVLGHYNFILGHSLFVDFLVETYPEFYKDYDERTNYGTCRLVKIKDKLLENLTTVVNKKWGYERRRTEVDKYGNPPRSPSVYNGDGWAHVRSAPTITDDPLDVLDNLPTSDKTAIFLMLDPEIFSKEEIRQLAYSSTFNQRKLVFQSELLELGQAIIQQATYQKQELEIKLANLDYQVLQHQEELDQLTLTNQDLAVDLKQDCQTLVEKWQELNQHNQELLMSCNNQTLSCKSLESKLVTGQQLLEQLEVNQAKIKELKQGYRERICQYQRASKTVAELTSEIEKAHLSFKKDLAKIQVENLVPPKPLDDPVQGRCCYRYTEGEYVSKCCGVDVQSGEYMCSKCIKTKTGQRQLRQMGISPKKLPSIGLNQSSGERKVPLHSVETNESSQSSSGPLIEPLTNHPEIARLMSERGKSRFGLEDLGVVDYPGDEDLKIIVHLESKMALLIYVTTEMTFTKVFKSDLLVIKELGLQHLGL